MHAVLQETPVYDRLVAKRGDVHAPVHGEADLSTASSRYCCGRVPVARPRQEPPDTFGPPTP